MKVICPYCQNLAKLVRGREIYPHRPDLNGLRFYLCRPCWAYVGCHSGTSKPKGSPANSELRDWRQRAHELFDPLWRSGAMSRHQAYDWLSARMELPVTETHIGMFDVERCKKVVEVCGIYHANAPSRPP